MSPTSQPDPEVEQTADEQESPPPACVLSFNASDASGAGGLAGDIATIAAMGAHCLPVVTAIVLRDTAEIFEHENLDPDTVAEQARHILEDVPITAWKVGFLGNAESVSAVAEVLSDYPDVPLVTYLPSVAWIDEDEQQSYLDALRELVLPQTAVLVGNHKTLTDFLLPDWDNERTPSARELAVAAAQAGAQHVLVTGIQLPNQFVDNVLANSQGPITGEKFERFETSFVGAGDTLAAALAALLSVGAELHSAVSEALSFLDQSLDAGFRPGMGNVIPDRFFWALPGAEEDGSEPEGFEPEPEPEQAPKTPRRMH
ncbi:bifunctional hydroxymethylpyrimidine kinase/phosphomethylpyrimidine kinase [Roseateles sp.]|uniref:bifunctional hydroxymethylpyrimidine kinase/phosphomethylpyrimidine kinase n=1 Tax=Roseateles sp. TaxID=1971397 RepID=UPI003BABB63D